MTSRSGRRYAGRNFFKNARHKYSASLRFGLALNEACLDTIR